MCRVEWRARGRESCFPFFLLLFLSICYFQEMKNLLCVLILVVCSYKTCQSLLTHTTIELFSSLLSVQSSWVEFIPCIFSTGNIFFFFLAHASALFLSTSQSVRRFQEENHLRRSIWFLIDFSSCLVGCSLDINWIGALRAREIDTAWDAVRIDNFLPFLVSLIEMFYCQRVEWRHAPRALKMASVRAVGTMARDYIIGHRLYYYTIVVRICTSKHTRISHLPLAKKLFSIVVILSRFFFLHRNNEEGGEQVMDAVKDPLSYPPLFFPFSFFTAPFM